MWRVFQSAFVRKLAYILAGALMALLIGHRARALDYVQAGSNCSTIGGTSLAGNYEGGSAMAAAIAFASDCPGKVSSTSSGKVIAITHDDAFAGGIYSYDIQICTNGAGCSAAIHTGGAISACAGGDTNCTADATCSAAPRVNALVAVKGNVGGTGGLYCLPTTVAGVTKNCAYTNDGNTLAIGGSKGGVVGGATAVGTVCTVGTNGAQSVVGNTNCAQNGAVSACVDTANSLASVNGDVLPPPSSGTAGTCTGFGDGAAACFVSMSVPLASPPAPAVSGTTPATPTAQVTSGTAVPTQNTVDYFTAAQVTASTQTVLTTSSHSGSNAPGTATGTGSATCVPSAPGVTPVVTCTGIGTGTGTSTGPLASNGDCGASSVDCVGDGTLPSLTRTDTIQSNVQDYLNSISSSPLFTSITAIETAWPASPACPSLPLTLFGKDMDLMTGACIVWGTDVAPTLSLVFLAIWACWGIRIVLSA